MSARKTERLLNLVICLLATSRFLTKAQIRQFVPQYADCETEEAFERMFERDKTELRDMGVPLETGLIGRWPDDDLGYRIDRASYALPEVSFAPDEMAVIGLAASVWQQASIAEAASYALLKLKAGGVEADQSALAGIAPLIRASEPSFPALWQAICARQPVRFDYRRPPTSQAVERHVEPWGIVSRHGRWYLVGHDQDRDAPRVFRLSRIVGDVVPDGPEGSVDIPADTDIRKQVLTFVPEPPQGDATVRLRVGRAHGLRRRATDVRPDPDHEGWDLASVRYWHEESFAEELMQSSDVAVILEPESIREEVIARLRAIAAGHRPGVPRQRQEVSAG